jgi:hypothetical protein
MASAPVDRSTALGFSGRVDVAVGGDRNADGILNIGNCRVFGCPRKPAGAGAARAASARIPAPSAILPRVTALRDAIAQPVLIFRAAGTGTASDHRFGYRADRFLIAQQDRAGGTEALSPARKW